MKVLVTGGAGYIGSITTRRLLAENHEVLVYDNLSTGFREAIPSPAKFVFGDIRDGALLGRVMKDEKIEAIIHFAAKLIVPESVEKPLEYYETNVLGGLRVIEAARANGVKAFIFSSTAAVYGNPETSPVSEQASLSPLNPYGASKAMIERVLMDLQATLPSVSLRYFNVAGASADLKSGQRTKSATHLVKVAAEVACGKRPSMAIFGTDYSTVDGTGVRDYIHVEDLADAHLLALNYLVDGGKSLVLNCGYGRGFSVRQVISAMEKVSGQKITVHSQQRRAGDAAEIVASPAKIFEVFPWSPKWDSLDEICRMAYEFERTLS